MLGWDTVVNSVFGATVVIGSKNVLFFLCCEKSREALRDVCSRVVSFVDWDEMVGDW